MIQLPRLFFLLAEAADAAPQADNPPAPGIGFFMPAIAATVVLYYILIIRPERRKQAGQKSQLDALKKNDRVVTIGGVYGVVMNVQRDADEVTLKVDEANNTKIRVTFGAIARVVGDDTASEKTA